MGIPREADQSRTLRIDIEQWREEWQCVYFFARSVRESVGFAWDSFDHVRRTTGVHRAACDFNAYVELLIHPLDSRSSGFLV